jgi:hypothetical protein
MIGNTASYGDFKHRLTIPPVMYHTTLLSN